MYISYNLEKKFLMKDLREYKEQINKNRTNKINEIINLSQEYGLYDQTWTF